MAVDSSPSRSRSQACATPTWVTTSSERPACQHEVELGERLDAAADAAARPAHALGDGPDLAVLGRQQGEDAIGLAEVEVGEDDGARLVGARTWHGASVSEPRRRPPSSMDDLLTTSIMFGC